MAISATEVLTAGHCLEGAEWAAVEFAGGVVVPTTEGAVGGPYGEDVGLLRAAVPASQPIASVGDPPTVGGPVFFSGYGCAHDLGEVRRAYARLREIPDVNANRYDGCVCHGDSGGPAFDRHGRVVGVMTHTTGWVTETSVLPWLRSLLAQLPAAAP